jgi:hypothetical protein
VGDRPAERTLRGALWINMYPLVVAGGVGEKVDLVLVDLESVRPAEVLTLELAQSLWSSNDGRHAGRRYARSLT